jgi:hypothetical protein
MQEKSSAESLPQQHSASVWKPWVRWSFRFVFLYWAVYLLPSPGAVTLLDLLPWLGDKLTKVLLWPMNKLAPWVGVHVFYLTGESANWHPTGSGDTAMHYIDFAVKLVLALVGAVIWSAVSETRGKRQQYRTAYAWLRLFLRFMLADTLLEYGFIKIFPAQFGPLGTYGLTESYGDSTPMHLLWTFIGQSRTYMIFGGLMEAIPGALLLFRRTSTVGLLGSAAVLLNVVMMNFAYDVPVKLYSLHLLLMTLFLLLPDIRPMWQFLMERKEASLTGVWVPRWDRRSLRIGGYVLQTLVVVGTLYNLVWINYQQTRVRSPAGPLKGMYAVSEAKGVAGNARWAQVFFEDHRGEHFLGLVGPDKKPRRYVVTYDVAAQTMRITDRDAPASFHWSKNEAGTLVLSGSFKGELASMNLLRTSPETFTLNSRGFHWVTEYPFNH